MTKFKNQHCLTASETLPTSFSERETFPGFCVFPAALLLWLLMAFWPGIPQIPHSALAPCLSLPGVASLAQGLLPPEVCRAPGTHHKTWGTESSLLNKCGLSLLLFAKSELLWDCMSI